jgi:hypothetical protein
MPPLDAGGVVMEPVSTADMGGLQGIGEKREVREFARVIQRNGSGGHFIPKSGISLNAAGTEPVSSGVTTLAP